MIKNHIVCVFRQCVQKQPLDVIYNKNVLKYFEIFTEKHLCWSLLQYECIRTPILENIWERIAVGCGGGH